MPFEARKTKFTVFTPYQEMCNLIKSAFKMKLQSKLTRTYKYQNHSGELIDSFLKACIVLNDLKKSDPALRIKQTMA